MFLLLDISVKDTIHLALFDKKTIEHKFYSGRNRELLGCIQKLVESKKYKVESISGIAVVVGVGGFTSTRIACVVANTFGYVFKIPLLAITLNQASDPRKLIPKLLKQKPGNFISATYSGEANIGRKKI